MKKHHETDQEDTGEAFDQLRASVNLVVSSILIALGTSLKLPLSTTYVTFMVAMGTSLADGAWGRESAVYRVTGVVLVVGGWFLTALVAFIISFIFINLLHFGGGLAIAVLIVFIGFMVYRTHFIHKKRVLEREKVKELDHRMDDASIIDVCVVNVIETLQSINEIYYETIESLITEDRKRLKSTFNKVTELDSHTESLKNNLHNVIKQFEESYIDPGPYYIQIIDYLRELGNCTRFITHPVFAHIDNNHKGLIPMQISEAQEFSSKIRLLLDEILKTMRLAQFDNIERFAVEQEQLLAYLNTIRKKQVKRIRKDETTTRNSLLYLNILSETKNLLLFVMHLIKAQRDFVLNTTKDLDKKRMVKSIKEMEAVIFN